MAVSIKNKIRSGTLFLFSLLILSAGISIYYLKKLQTDAEKILTANYESLDYCHQMQQQLDSTAIAPQMALAHFDFLLKRQENNITEAGEAQETHALRMAYANMAGGSDTGARQSYTAARQHIQNILTLNMKAISRKSAQARATAATAFTSIVLISVLTFIIGLTFTINFPAIVVTPVRKLIETIKEISAKNYTHRIHLENKDEFGQLANAFNNMTERLEEFENSNLNKIIFEKTRAEAVINSLKDASIGIDKQGNILFANEQALQLLGLPAPEIVGKTVAAVAAANNLFHFLITSETTAPFKIVVDEKENYYVKEVIQIAQGEAGNKVIVLKNITSFKELDVAKTNFIATISHELKTPLASSDLSLKLLEDERIGPLGQEQKELVQQLKNDNQRMLQILSELLNMSQIEAGKIQLNITAVDVNDMIAASLQNVISAVREKQIHIAQSLAELPAINADADKISWVLNNFLTNAIRFSPVEGTIHISSYQADNKVTVAVKDEGPGIDEAFYKKIFDRYFQIPGRSDKKGSGIGLAICKELIQAMGGEIWVKSGMGEGSTFGFDIYKS